MGNNHGFCVDSLSTLRMDLACLVCRFFFAREGRRSMGGGTLKRYLLKNSASLAVLFFNSLAMVGDEGLEPPTRCV